MLKFDEKKENLDNIKAIKEEICKNIEHEDHMIEKEINDLKKLNLTRETIEKGSYDLSGISQTSLLIYANEYLAQLDDKGDGKEYSFKCKPGQAIIDFINKEFVEDNYYALPTILMKAFMSNTYFYTRMVEMCQYR